MVTEFIELQNATSDQEWDEAFCRGCFESDLMKVIVRLRWPLRHESNNMDAEYNMKFLQQYKDLLGELKTVMLEQPFCVKQKSFYIQGAISRYSKERKDNPGNHLTLS